MYLGTSLFPRCTVEKRRGLPQGIGNQGSEPPKAGEETTLREVRS